MKPNIVRRYRCNPILTRAAIPYPVETVHNAAVVKHGDKYVMLFRSHLRTGRCIIGLARSPNGFQFTADPEPFLTPARDSPFAAYEEFGVEQCAECHEITGAPFGAEQCPPEASAVFVIHNRRTHHLQWWQDDPSDCRGDRA